MQGNRDIKIMPIAPLMIEHRLIERMIKLLREELRRIDQGNEVDLDLIKMGIDFFRVYADRCHHGKEEDILFRELSQKKLSSEHKNTLEELKKEHVLGRRTVDRLEAARGNYVKSDTNAKRQIAESLKTLVELYPSHIEKEDRHFFIPSMAYFTKQEQDLMLKKCWEFDREMIHEKYREVVKQLES